MKKPYERCLTLTHHKPITTLSLSSTGQVLLLGSTVGDIDIWDATMGTSEGRPRRCHFPSSGSITCLKISDSSTTHIYAASQTGELCHWYWDGSRHIFNHYPPNGGLSVQAISIHWSELRAVFMHFAGQMRICTWKSGLKGECVTRYLAGMKSSSTCSAFSPTGSHLFVGDEVGTLSVWISDTGQPSKRPLEYTRTPTNGQGELLYPSADVPKCISLVPSPNGADVLVGYSNGEFRLWNIASGHYTVIRIPPRQATIPAYNSLPLTFSSDGSLILFPSFEERRRIEVYELKTGYRFLTCHLEDWPEGAIVKQIILSPDKSRLILSFEGSTTVLIFCWPVERWYYHVYSIRFQVALSMAVVACLCALPHSILNNIISDWVGPLLVFFAVSFFFTYFDFGLIDIR
jgi:WD40 repeat protein